MLHIAVYRFNTMAVWLLIFGCLLCALLPVHTSAQAPSFVANSIYLESVPQYPEPNSSVNVSVNDYSVNTLGATISWFVNGVEQVTSKNERSIKVPTRELGTQEDVKVVLSRTNSPSLSATLTLTPVVIDIILEADTYIPSFYKGRALPSQDSSVRAIALVHDTDGGIKNEYVYKWSLDDTVLMGGAVKGKNSINFVTPSFRDSELTVQIFDTNGKTVSKKSMTISAIDPEMHFYEYSSLRGLSERAAVSPLPFIAEEITLSGEPYFMNSRMDTNKMNFNWMLDNDFVTPDATTPNALTLRRNEGSGSSFVSLEIIMNSRIPQFVKQELQLIF